MVDGEDKTFETFLLDGRYHSNSCEYISPEDIKEIRHNPDRDWQEFKHAGVDYDCNIIDNTPAQFNN